MPARPDLTPHQRGVLRSIKQMARSSHQGWVDAQWVGSRGACQRLMEKGYIEQRTEVGPRGGTYFFYRIIQEEHHD